MEKHKEDLTIPFIIERQQHNPYSIYSKFFIFLDQITFNFSAKFGKDIVCTNFDVELGLYQDVLTNKKINVKRNQIKDSLCNISAKYVTLIGLIVLVINFGIMSGFSVLHNTYDSIAAKLSSSSTNLPVQEKALTENKIEVCSKMINFLKLKEQRELAGVNPLFSNEEIKEITELEKQIKTNEWQCAK